MGWRPWETRAASLPDFSAAFEGWAKANGISSGSRLDEDDVDHLMDLMETL